MHRHAGSHSADTRSRPASGRRPNIVGMRLRWRTLTGIRARSSEMMGVAPNYTTSCGRLKQPDKQKTTRQIQEPIDRARTLLWFPVFTPLSTFKDYSKRLKTKPENAGTKHRTLAFAVLQQSWYFGQAAVRRLRHCLALHTKIRVQVQFHKE
jgi:hypothetical protein